MKKCYLIKSMWLSLITLIFTLPLSMRAQTYNFESDMVGSIPTNVTPTNGTVTTDFEASRGKTLNPLTFAMGNTCAFDMDLFPTAKDYSITWKETYTTVGRSAFTLRGFGDFTGGGNHQLQGFIFQANAAQNFATIYRADTGGTAILVKNPLEAPGENVPRWYRATVDGALLTFEYSDDGTNFTEVASVIEGVYVSAGKTQFTRGYGFAVEGSFIDDIVFTPITTSSIVYDFEADTANALPANITTANGTITTNSDSGRTNTIQPLTVSTGNTAAFNLDLFPSASDYVVMWKETFDAAGRTGMLLRGSGSNSTKDGVKEGYLFEASSSEGMMRISKSKPNGFEMLAEMPLEARNIGGNRWYRAVADEDKLSFEWSNNGRDFNEILSVTDATYATGTTQFITGFGASVSDSYIDNIVFTPLQTAPLSTNNVNVSEFKIFPNPANNIVNVSLNTRGNKASTIIIYDVQGKVVSKTENVVEKLVSIKVSSLRTGMYFLKIKTGVSEHTEKLIVK